MPALTMFGLWKSAQIALPLLKAGGSMLRSAMTSGSEAGEWEKGVQGILGDQVKELLKAKIDKFSPQKLEAVEAPLVSFTGLVLQSLVQDVLVTDDFAAVESAFSAALPQLPRHWKTFVAQGLPGAQPLMDKDFLAALQSVQEGEGAAPAVKTEWLAAFFSQWIRGEIGEVPFREGVHHKLATAVAPLIADSVSSTLTADHPVAATAFRESMLRFHTDLRQSLQQIDTRTTEIAKTQKKESSKATKRHKQVKSDLGEVKSMLKTQTSADRIKKYRDALLTAFRPYQELGIDDYEGGEQETSDIRDIFVHPACSKNHLRPEDMDAAQRETPPRLPAQDMLQMLAQDDHRRTVLLADPGMGKSTLIQSLTAHLASERAFTSAAALNGLLPVPLILRDLVPLLPQDQVESWNWDSLLTVLIETYQRDETAPPLCDCFKSDGGEFRRHLRIDAKVFFLIDGLDEIGDLTKRRQIVTCIQDGIRAANKDARWLITSRVIGYEDAPVDLIRIRIPEYEFARFVPLKMSKLKIPNLEPNYMVHEKVWDVICKEFKDLAIPFDPPITERRWDELSSTNFFQKSIPVMFGFGGQKLLAVPDRDGLDVAGQICHRLHLAPFDDKRQDSFTQRWFKHRHSTDYSRELMREVRAHHHDGVRIISRVPNLLCMMNILKRSGKPLPDGRAALYDAIANAYLGGIDSAYRHKPILGLTCPFDPAERRFLLSLIGADMQDTRTVLDGVNQDNNEPKFAGNILISHSNLEKLLSPAIDSMREAGKVQSPHSTADLLNELLHHIASRSGLLIPRTSDADGNTLYGFTHLSFLEYFAAKWLGMEFDRQRNRNSRRAEATDDGQVITETDLEHEFPPQGPIQHFREAFKDLPATPAWHEPLIFLLESRKADTRTLLRWLFPALHTPQRSVGSPLLPLNAVRLAVKLAQDPEILLPVATRQNWWRVLWSAYFEWPRPPWFTGETPGWPIAPLLLDGQKHQLECVQMLSKVQPKHPNRPLYLNGCSRLSRVDLTIFAELDKLEWLDLSHCTGLASLPDLKRLTALKELWLAGCTGLVSADALNGLQDLISLESLYLRNCTSLTSLPDLRHLANLQVLDISGCTNLPTKEQLQKRVRASCWLVGP